MLSLRAFMFEHVYLGPQTREEHERAREIDPRRSSSTWPRGVTRPEAIVDYVSGMTDRFALEFAAKLYGADQERVGRGGEGGREHRRRSSRRATRLRKVGGRYTGLCLFHEEKTPSFSVSPDARDVPLLRLRRRAATRSRSCGRPRASTSSARSSSSPTGSACRSSTRSRRRRPTASARQRDRLFALLEQAAAYYERRLWEARRRRLRARVPRLALARRGGLPRVPARPLAGRRAAGRSKAKEKGFTRDELAAAGLVTRRGSDYFQRRLMFPLTDARGRVIGFQARKLHEDDPLRGKYVNSPESELFRKSNVLYGFHLARPAIAKQDRAVVVEGNTDVIALRQAGLEPVVASMGTALTERSCGELGEADEPRVPLLRRATRPGRTRRCAGWSSRSSLGSTSASSRSRRAADPADDPAGFEARLETAEPYAVHRVRLELDRARDRQLAYLRVQEVPERDPRVARAPRRVAARERPARPDRRAARRPGRPRSARAALAARRGGRGQAGAERPRRRPRASRSWAACSRRSAPSTSTRS